MDVDQTQFLPNLLAILRSISAASFISFDLEMSGINDKVRVNAKCSLEKHYEETKSAVEKYEVLQVGITCVREDREQGEFLLHYPVSLLIVLHYRSVHSYSIQYQRQPALPQ
jgi:poly(A)-specific ribonuclease